LKASSPGPNEGSSFLLTLPLTMTPPPSPKSNTSTPFDTVPLQILLLEDHADTALVMKSVLGSIGHTIDLCSTVAAAVQKATTQKYDLFLSDIGLPDGSGTDFIRQAREVTDTPAIALSGYGMDEDIEKCLTAGFNEHLTKPVDFEKLRRTIARIAAYGSSEKES
jgi:CheY-like chemotaxis protein